MMTEELKLEAMEERASYEAEIARLREALKRIVKLNDHNFNLSDASEIAKEALEQSDD